MLLTLDISNTSIKAGVFRNDTLLHDWRFATERHKLTDEYAILLFNLFKIRNISVDDISGVVISCVVPPLRSVFHQLSQKYLQREPIIVSPNINTGIILAVHNPFEVGADRIVNALATHRFYNGPAIAIAFGTATVFDCVSAKGEYLGGAIAPGMVGALESLTQRAAQLYQVELIRPPDVIGKSTVETLQSGLIFGYAGLVEGLVKRLKASMGSAHNGQKVTVVATGGLSDIIMPETDVIDVVDHQLTLKGLQVIYRLNT